jgi:hypothetical protein
MLNAAKEQALPALAEAGLTLSLANPAQTDMRCKDHDGRCQHQQKQ